MPRQQRSNPKTKHKAIQLRKKSTPAERQLWLRIRNDQPGFTFRRQHAIGNSIPQFCSPKAKLLFELDGSQHLDQKEYDEERTKYSEARIYRVLRFRNREVMKDMETVLKVILGVLNKNG